MVTGPAGRACEENRLMPALVGLFPYQRKLVADKPQFKLTISSSKDSGGGVADEKIRIGERN
jgi:hypothetical protein